MTDKPPAAGDQPYIREPGTTPLWAPPTLPPGAIRLIENDQWLQGLGLREDFFRGLASSSSGDFANSIEKLRRIMAEDKAEARESGYREGYADAEREATGELERYQAEKIKAVDDAHQIGYLTGWKVAKAVTPWLGYILATTLSSAFTIVVLAALRPFWN